MKKWVVLLALLVLFVGVALLFSEYSKAALGMGIGALAKTLLDQVFDDLSGETADV